MAIKYESRCKVCRAIKKDQKLKDRIYSSSWFDSQSPDSLNAIADDNMHLFSRIALYNHIHKHGTVTPSRVKYRNEKMLASMRGEKIPRKGNDKGGRALQVLEGIVPELLDPQNASIKSTSDTEYEQGLDDIILIGVDEIKKGTMKLNATHVLTAIKIKSDIEAKTKDRKMDFVTAIAAMAAGSNSGN